MARNWRPGPVALKRLGELWQRTVSQQIRSATPPQRGGQTGGSLGAKARSRSLLRVERWGVVLLWSRLGQKLTFFIRGTKRGQPPRPVQLTPPRERVKRAAVADARRFYKARERRYAA